jgi:hypothetical protein
MSFDGLTVTFMRRSYLDNAYRKTPMMKLAHLPAKCGAITYGNIGEGAPSYPPLEGQGNRMCKHKPGIGGALVDMFVQRFTFVHALTRTCNRPAWRGRVRTICNVRFGCDGPALKPSRRRPKLTGCRLDGSPPILRWG